MLELSIFLFLPPSAFGRAVVYDVDFPCHTHSFLLYISLVLVNGYRT